MIVPPRRDDRIAGDDKRLVRHCKSYGLASLSYAFRRLNGIGQMDYLIALAVWNSNVRHLIFDGPKLERVSFEMPIVPPELKRAVSRSAISRFLNVPFETVRRRSAVLIARGIVAEHPDGLVSVAMNAALTGGFLDVELNNSRSLVNLHRLAVDDGIEIASANWASLIGTNENLNESWVRAVNRVSIDYIMIMFSELLRTLNVNIGELLILLLVSRNNVAHLLNHREHKSNDAVAPNGLRRGVSRKDVAQSLEVPAETVRRKVARLSERGMLLERSDGFIVPESLFKALIVAGVERHNSRAIRRVFSTLHDLYLRRQAQEIRCLAS